MLDLNFALRHMVNSPDIPKKFVENFALCLHQNRDQFNANYGTLRQILFLSLNTVLQNKIAFTEKEVDDFLARFKVVDNKIPTKPSTFKEQVLYLLSIST